MVFGKLRIKSHFEKKSYCYYSVRSLTDEQNQYAPF